MTAAAPADGSDSVDVAEVTGGVRASDADRDRVLNELKLRYAEGRLSSDTFVARMDVVLAARYRGELNAQLADLPRRRPLADLIAIPANWLSAHATQLVRHLREAAGTRPYPKQPPMMISLVLPASPQERFSIGRDLACDFTVADISVSRWHAKLCRDEDGWMLSDLGSTNGTRLNGWRVTTAVPVRAGDQVSFGGARYVITDRPL